MGQTPAFDLSTLPEQILPGDSIRLRGEAAPGALLRVAVNDKVVSTAVAGDTGAFRTTLGFSAPGTYTVTVSVIGDNDEVVAVSEAVAIVVGDAEQAATPTPTAAPVAVSTVAAPVLDASSLPATILPGDSVRLRGVAEPGSTVRVAVNDRVVASAIAGDTGAFRATVGFGQAGDYTVIASVVDEDDAVIAASDPLTVTVAEAAPAATNTPTLAPSPTPTNTMAPTPTPQPTATPLPTATNTNTPAPTATATPTDTPAPTATSTNTPAPTATSTPLPTATATDTPAPEVSAPVLDLTGIPDEILPGASVRLRGEAEPGSTVRVAVNDRVVASAIAGDTGAFRATVGFGQAGEYTVTASIVDDEENVLASSEPVLFLVVEPTPVATDTPTAAPTPTATNTPVPPTATATPTDTPAPTPTDTPAPTATSTPLPTATATDTPAPTATDTATPEPTATNTPEPTATATDTATPEPTATNTPEPPTATPTDTPEPTPTAMPEPVAPVLDAATVPSQIVAGDSFRLRGEAAPGSTVQVLLNDRVVSTVVVGDSGAFRATVGIGAPGEYTLVLQTVDEAGAVLIAAEPVMLMVVEPTPTEAAPTATPVQILAPTATPMAEAEAPIEPSEVMTETVEPVAGVAQPDELPSTGVSIDHLGGMNVLIPLALVVSLVGATLFQTLFSRRRR
ncbi:MAG: hypothetical protein KJZ93_21965 [Caldilineaceae bacterium]|nr:hypothetical protein [Caldilineaceae bacterium]